MTVFLSILNQMEFHLAQNRKETRHHDHIPFNVKGNENVVFPVFCAHESFHSNQTFQHLGKDVN